MIHYHIISHSDFTLIPNMINSTPCCDSQKMQKLIHFCALILHFWLVSCNHVQNSAHFESNQSLNKHSKNEKKMQSERVNCNLQTKYRKILPAFYANFYSQSSNSHLEDMQNKPLSSKSTKDLKIDDSVRFKIDTEILPAESTESITGESKKKTNFAKKDKELHSYFQGSAVGPTSKHHTGQLPMPRPKRFYSTFNLYKKKPKSVWIERYLKNLSNRNPEVKNISSSDKRTESSFVHQQSMASGENRPGSKLKEHSKIIHPNRTSENNARIARLRELKYKKMMNTADLYCERIEQCEGCKQVTSPKKINAKHY